MLCRAKLDMLEEKNAEVQQIKARMERMQREYEERLHGTATELQRLQLEKTLLQVSHLISALLSQHIGLAQESPECIDMWHSHRMSRFGYQRLHHEHRVRLVQEAGEQNILSAR